MEGRLRGRYLAPLALVGVLVAVGLLLRAELQASPRAPATPVIATSLAGTTTTGPPPMFYTVKEGDSLSTVAAKTGVPEGQLEALNPNVNPNVLHIGQRLRLRQ